LKIVKPLREENSASFKTLKKIKPPEEDRAYLENPVK